MDHCSLQLKDEKSNFSVILTITAIAVYILLEYYLTFKSLIENTLVYDSFQDFYWISIGDAYHILGSYPNLSPLFINL
ncbi:UNVERIFIED_CONTAM: hypothetical protein NCL1_40933 [Trichonephila clavipes]